ncbi:peptidyl-alpha-hydroxyglycine alpha-amidating lyase family protein, partial [Acidobacteria bacterium AH-259-O06]|nr:peptidyl-alpha-hydroxyglycine alpha-amidating lyase family protein [Acidobacteria bacterium AH-259-O06]
FALVLMSCGVPEETPAETAESAAPDVLDYQVVEGWPQLPEDWTLGEVSGVAIDNDRDVLVFNRGEHPLLEFKLDGTFVRSWGEGTVSRAHGLRVDAENNIWTTDVEAHTVTKYDQEGNVLMVLGEKGKPGEDESHFNAPADIAFAPNGDFFVADGYGNSRVVKFDQNGKFIKAWGTKGTGQGEFNLVHAVVLDSQGLLYVADRENNRIQIFDQDGNFIKMWTHLGAPFGFFMTPGGKLYMTDGRAHKVIIADLEGNLLSSFGLEGTEPGQFNLPHDIAVSPTGEVYVAEIRNMRVQKFTSNRTEGSGT